MLPGANTEESINNLYKDTVARSVLPSRAFVTTCDGETQQGLYHHMKSGELEKFIGELSIRLQDWGAQCTANQKSCGSVYQADGSGAGKVTLTPFELGPFRH